MCLYKVYTLQANNPSFLQNHEGNIISWNAITLQDLDCAYEQLWLFLDGIWERERQRGVDWHQNRDDWSCQDNWYPGSQVYVGGSVGDKWNDNDGLFTAISESLTKMDGHLNN